MLIVFGLLEFVAPPSAFQPVVSLLLGITILAIFLARKLVTKYAAFGLMILTGVLTLVNISLMNLHVTTGWADSKSPWPEIDRLLDEKFIGSVLIAKDGKIFLEKSYSYADRNRLIPNTHNTKFMIGSMTKQFTAMGILILRDQDKLKLEDSVLGYVLLGYIIENVSGKPYGDFIKDEIFTPLKMNSSGYGYQAPYMATGYINSFFKTYYIKISRVHGAGGLHSTVDDLYQWDQALYGEQLVKKETLDEIFTPRVSMQGPYDASYAYGWMVSQVNGHPMVAHGGSIG